MNGQRQDVYRDGMNTYQQLMPQIADRYNDFTGVCFEDSALRKKEKELIALGISLSHRDENCVRYHVGEALQKGATEAEVWDAVNVAIAMSGGMILSQSVYWVHDAVSAGAQRQ